MRAARTLGLTAALLFMLAAGLWIGGHPARMPPVLRDVFVDESAGLTAEASELIEDNYYRPVSQGKLIDSSLQGMVRGLRRRYQRPLLRLLLAGSRWPASTRKSRGASRGSASA